MITFFAYFVEELNSKPSLGRFHCFHGYKSSVSPVLHFLRLPRVMSESWMTRSGRSSRTSPMDELVPLHSFPPPLPLLPPRLPLLLLGYQPPLPLPLPLLDGLCVTWAPLLLRLVSPLQWDQPDPNPIPPAATLVCRYTQSQVSRSLQALFMSWSCGDFLYFSLGVWPWSTEQEHIEQDFL